MNSKHGEHYGTERVSQMWYCFKKNGQKLDYFLQNFQIYLLNILVKLA